ncbi:hypothetical protein ACFV9E_06625 [Streptomyces sp. NPDC059835]|uniref:hypothetical protein n=1 Tax=Streptomyces sp. NPDC059835 TaxID=3346967 RepID=UPI0036532176
MSFIQFQDPHGTARLRGPERHRMLSLVHDTAATLLLGSDAAERAHTLYGLLPEDHELREFPPPHSRHTAAWQRQYVQDVRSIFNDPLVTYRGEDLALSSMLLNTAMALGGDAVRLAARLHGQCEINCWIDGPNRAWLADVVQGGLDDGSFRSGAGWDGVVDLLHQRDDHPVVMSFADTFPSFWSARSTDLGVPDADTDELVEVWEALPAAEQWRLALQALKARTDDGLEIQPNWTSYRFGHEVSFLDILADDRVERLDRALGLAPHTSETARD